MYLTDLRTNTIHDLSHPRYECHIEDIPEESGKKIYTLDTVKRMCESEHIPRFQGCQYCMPDFYFFDMNKIF
ncbi:hypothetical protein CEE37_00530 [candidate division LCP-89 bacterium B3_LCP]|uniref:Uncharacterized protein n=1 Tax=candidate division LCP-89 bacterium B3_LCP TaxID=2012998 RepID=A0A532V4R8_UNCL8|nr:MAG: hypothetical protein CEE37_00530 [candidate division LCP-89 bacterium B3_LCP]